MDKKKKITSGKLKLLFSDLINGYNHSHHKEMGDLYFKHLKLYESALIESGVDDFAEAAKKKGVPTEKDQLDYLIKEKLWTEESEKKVTDGEIYVDGLKRAKNRTFIKKQKEELQSKIEEEAKKLLDLKIEKDGLIGYTVEKYAAKKGNEQYVFRVLYKEKECKNLFYTEEEFQDISDDTIRILVTEYNKIHDLVNEENIKHLALSPFFLNIFYLCDDNPYHFYGKPVLELTYYQNELFSNARYYKHLLSEAKTKPPEKVMSDPEAFVEWFESSKQAEKILEKSKDKENSAISLVGASKEDLDHLGLNDSEQGGKALSLSAAARKKGGHLSMEDIVKLHE